MKPVLTDRMAVIVIVAGLVLWVCCLTVLWGWAYDPSGSFSLLSLLAMLGGCWVFLSLRSRLLRWAVKTLHLLRLEQHIPLGDAIAEKIGSTREDARKRMQLLAAGSVLAVVCFICSTLCIPAAAAAATLLGQFFLFSDLMWRLIEIVTLAMGSIGVAAGLTAVAFASKVARASGGRDTYAAVYRDWLWGVGLAAAVFAISWWFGANLILLVFSTALVIIAVALTAVSRGELATHPRKPMLPFGDPPRRARLKIAMGHACFALVLLIQLRLLGDVFSVSLPRRMMWIFLSLGLLAYFLSRGDRKSHPPGRRQIFGAITGVAAAMLAQAAELIVCLSLDKGVMLVVILAVGTQIPLAAMAATLLSHQRKTFAIAGGTVGGYLTAAMGGLAVAVLGWLLGGTVGWGGWLLVAGGVGMIFFGGLSVSRLTGKKSERIAPIAWAVVLGGSLVAGLIASVWAIDADIQTGTWLSSKCSKSRAQKLFSQHGVQPAATGRRSELITECVGEVFTRRKGRWWIVATAAEDLPPRPVRGTPSKIFARVFPRGANPQPPSVPRRYKRRWPPLSYSSPDFFRYARGNFVASLGHEFYDGIFLAPLPADHPQAWRCYNDKMMRRCMAMAQTTDGQWGVVALRTQVGPDRVRHALNVARTFYKTVRSGWAVVAIRKKGVDILLLGPDEALAGAEEANIVTLLREKTKNQYDVFLVRINKLWPGWDEMRTIYIFSPPGERYAGTPTIKGLREWLTAAVKLPESEAP